MSLPSPCSPPALSNQVPAVEPGSRAQRLRLSCDACAVAKVKCDKEHPRCGRCGQTSITCIYSVSRKYGKGRQKRQSTDSYIHPARRELAPAYHPAPIYQDSYNPAFSTPFDELLRDDTWPSNAIPNSTGKLPWNQLTPSSFFVDQYTGLYESATECIASPHTASEHINEKFLDKFLDAQDNMSSESPVSTNLFQDFMSPDAAHATDALMISASPSSETQVPNSTPVDPPGMCPDSPEAHSCYALARSTLESLYSQSRSSNPTFDRILHSNKAATSSLQQLLTCPCACDPALAMLYASIVSKIIIGYQVAGGVPNCLSPPPMRAFMPTPPETVSGTATQMSRSGCRFSFERQGKTVRLPITVGDFELDEEDQEALGRQLLLSELKKTGRLIDLLAMKQSDLSDDTHGGLGDLYSMLGGWLRSELLRTIKEVKKGQGR